MGLFDTIKKRQQGSSPAAAPQAKTAPPITDDPDVARMQRMMTMSIEQWLIESQPDWAKCDGNAPEASATNAAAVRSIFMRVLPLDEQATVGQMPMLLLCWGGVSRPSRMTYCICSGCGDKLQMIGDFAGQSFPTTCAKCGKPIDRFRVEYSREVGRALREFLVDHAKCCVAIKNLQTAIKTELTNPVRLQGLIDEALKIAKAVAHIPAIKAVARASCFVNLTYTFMIATHAVQEAQASPTDMVKLDDALAKVRQVTQEGWQLQNAEEFALAINAYTQSTHLFEKLVALSATTKVRQPLAYDLDELGILLRVHEPARRSEGLAMVRRALHLLEQNRDEAGTADPELESAIQAVREHLRMEW